MSESQEQNESRLSFQESVKYLTGFIAKMLESNGKLRTGEEKILSNAQNTGDAKGQYISGIAINSFQNDEALYMIARYLLNVLETQALVNQQLLKHIKSVARKSIDLTPATIGEIVKSGLDQLAKEAELKARKLPQSLYA